MEDTIQLRTQVQDEDGNSFLADLTIEMSEIKQRLGALGLKIVKKK